MNVDAIVSNAGSDVLDLLEKMPAVTVDRDGNISIKGRQHVQVMIDGRPAYLSGNALANMLRGMNANQIRQIEVMTNPSARYEAGGSAGIINIVLKKNDKRGVNGDISLGYGQGRYWKTFNSMNLNYRKKNINLFLNYGVNADQTFYNLTNHQQIFGNNGSASNYLEQYTGFKDRNTNHNVKVGFDYDLSQRSSFGLIFSGFVAPATSDYTTNATLANSFHQVDSFLITSAHSSVRWNNRSINPYFSHRFDSLSSLSADATFVHYTSNTDQDVLNTSADSANSHLRQELVQIHIPFQINIYAGKLDYNRMLKNIGRLEAGFKTAHSQIESASWYFTENASGSLQLDLSLSNQFRYRENIYAGYASFSGKSGKWAYTAGARYEKQTHSRRPSVIHRNPILLLQSGTGMFSLHFW